MSPQNSLLNNLHTRNHCMIQGLYVTYKLCYTFRCIIQKRSVIMTYATEEKGITLLENLQINYQRAYIENT